MAIGGQRGDQAPGVAVRHPRRQPAGGDLRKAYLVEYAAHRRTDRDPQLRQVGRRALVDDLLRALAAYARERSVHRAEHRADGDLRRWAGEPVAALGTTKGVCQTGTAQLAQDRFKELAGQPVSSARACADTVAGYAAASPSAARTA
jgi:hypothetical protein